MGSLQNFKAQFCTNQGLTHLNNAGLAPISKASAERVKYWAQRFCEQGFYSDAEYMEEVKQSRIALAQLIDCEWNEIAFFQSTAGAISQIAFGLNLKAGDEVIMWDQEYSSNLYPWKAACDQAGAKLILVPSGPSMTTPVQKLLDSVTARTRAIAISWIQFQTGAETDLQELGHFCREKGIFSCVDAIQGLGIHHFSMKKWQLDAVCGGSHKWLVSPVGVGFLALDPKHFAGIQPRTIGSGTYGTCDDPSDLLCEPKTDATKYEAGSKQVLEIVALGASVRLILETGVSVIEGEIQRLANMLRAGLKERGCELHSPFSGVTSNSSAMVNFTPPASIQAKKLLETFRTSQVNFALRGPGIRISLHAFNSDDDVKKLLQLI